MASSSGIPDPFVRAMLAAAEIVGVNITPDRIAGYWALLAREDIDSLCRGVMAAVRSATNSRLPLPAEIIAAIEGDADNVENEAEVAWAMLQKALCGDAVPGSFWKDQRVEMGIAACGGMYLLRTGWDDEPMKWKHQKFVRAFCGTASARRRAVSGEPTAIGNILHGMTLDDGRELPIPVKQIGKPS